MPIKGTLREQKHAAEKRNDNLDGGRPWRLLDFFAYFILIVCCMLAVRSVVVDPVRVDGSSMLDTLAHNDIMLVNRLSYTLESPKRGDIVLCYYPDAYYEEQGLKYASRVKRVIAVAGDTIETRDNTVYVNGEAVDEPYLTPDRIGSLYIPRQTIPGDCVYVLGDNRSVSRDSRNDAVGPIPLNRVVGKVKMVLFPFSKLHFVK